MSFVTINDLTQKNFGRTNKHAACQAISGSLSEVKSKIENFLKKNQNAIIRSKDTVLENITIVNEISQKNEGSLHKFFREWLSSYGFDWLKTEISLPPYMNIANDPRSDNL